LFLVNAELQTGLQSVLRSLRRCQLLWRMIWRRVQWLSSGHWGCLTFSAR